MALAGCGMKQKKACVQNAPASVQTAHTSQLVRATGVKG